MKTTAYVYKWTHLPTMKWYVGSRSQKGCHPSDGYICSSKTVAPNINSLPDQWKREIIATGTPEEMRQLEVEILNLFDAVVDSTSLNRHNAIARFNGSVNLGIKKQPEHASKLIANLVKINKSRTGTTGTWTGKQHSDESKKLQRAAKIGSKNSRWSGLYIDASGNKFETAYAAGKSCGVSHMTIYRWIKTNHNGWSLLSKNMLENTINMGSNTEQSVKYKGEVND